MPMSRETSFLRNTYYPKIISHWGGGHEIYNFLSPYATDATNQTKLRLVVNARRMTDDDRRQPIAIGHPSYSSDLKIECLLCSMF